MSFTIHRAETDSNNFFRNAKQGDFIIGVTDSNKRIILGNTSNSFSVMELGSNVATINGSMLATHMSTNTINSAHISFYMPTDPGDEYPNYTMPGTIADAVWSSNMWSSNGLFGDINSTLFSVNVNAEFESNLTSLGAATLSNTTLMVGDTTIMGEASFSNNTFMSSKLSVQGPVAIEGVLTVEGESSMERSVYMASNLIVHGNIEVNSLSKLSHVDISSNLNVRGSLGIDSNLDVSGKTSLHNIHVSNNLTVDGETSLSNAVHMYGPVTSTDNAYFHSNVSIDGSLNVTTINYGYSNVTIFTSEVIRSNLSVLGTTTSSNIGIGTDAPSYPLHVVSEVGGVSIFASHDITAFSDKRVKTDLHVIENALDKVRAISGYTFTRIPDANNTFTKRQCGLIAQELYTVLPEAVHTDPNSGMLTVAYGNVISLVVNAIKELEERVTELTKPKLFL
jgi:cytoskeletal protein CcmA (bactofilin family)